MVRLNLKTHISARSDSVDPLDILSAPPKDETPEQRAMREREEAEARRVSDLIDEQLKAERTSRAKRKQPVKVLLLGQSESGKSTTVKNFQISYAQKAWSEERASWRSVILLNLVRSVNIILDVLSREMAHSKTAAQYSLRLPLSASEGTDSDDASDSDIRSQASASGSKSSHNSLGLYSIRRPRTQQSRHFTFAEHHKILELRLGPLRRVQRDLEERLCSDELDSCSTGPAAPFVEQESMAAGKRRSYVRPREFFVRSRAGWKGALGWAMRYGRTKRGKDTETDEAMEVIMGCKEDIVALWEDATVQALLVKRRMQLEESPGFFLNDVDRIVRRDYEPSDDDVVRARLRTLGVQEYSFTFEKGREAGREWIMYDVGGARSCRSAWYPYFMDVNAIIFLAPISVFDEPLEEDPSVNRLEDTYMLWKAVVSSKLLTKVQLILFLNKCDLLERKLDRGISIAHYVPTYGDRPNDMPTAAKYFRRQFRDIMRKHSPVQRPFFSYLTTAIDTQATAHTLATVREGLMRDHLEKAELLVSPL
ncbi:G-alpha-domain-containing protein [Amylostereum chailletii]|nr:G-alpha-domain-containing protein [Amylostereum chailletii]